MHQTPSNYVIILDATACRSTIKIYNKWQKRLQNTKITSKDANKYCQHV